MKKIGYLLYREDTDEFLATYKFSQDMVNFAWCQNPGNAMCLPNHNQAKYHQRKLNENVELKIVTLFDQGGKYMVEFDHP